MTEPYIPKEWPDAAARAAMARHNLRVEDLIYPPPVHAKIVYAGWQRSPNLDVYHGLSIPEVGQLVPLAGDKLRLRVARKEFVEEERTWYLYCEADE